MSLSIPRLYPYYYPDGCGICEKEGGDIYLYAPYRPHGPCFKAVEVSQSIIYETVNELFVTKTFTYEKNEALICAFKAVRKACGEYTILTYLEKNGVDALTELFCTVGVSAIDRYAVKVLF